MPGPGSAGLIPRAGVGAKASIAGAQLAAVAYLLFTCQDATIKCLLPSFAIWQLLSVRSAIVLAGCVAVGGGRLIRLSCTSSVRWVLAARALSSLAAWWCFFEAAKTLPLGDLTTLYLVAPLMATGLSAYLLRERIGYRNCIALGLGALGTLAAVEPIQSATPGPVLLVFAGAGFWALAMVLMRWIGQRESSLVQLTSNNVIILVVTTAMAMGHWRVPSADHVLMMVAVGVLSGVGQWLLIASAKRAPVSVIVSLQYTGLLWAFILGFLVWGSIPSQKMVLGAILIGASGVFALTARAPGDPGQTRPVLRSLPAR